MKNYRTLLLITAAAFLYRFLQLLVFWREIVVENDQVNYITLGRKFADGDFYGMLDTYWSPVFPFLIGVTTLVVDSLVVPAAIVSIIGSTLIVSLAYVLVKDSYGESYGIIAGVLAVFYPHLINSMFALQSENVYAVFMIAALIVGWKGINSGSLWLFFATGILVGLAYLTRPEAIVYLLFFTVFALFKDVWHGRRFSKRSFAMIGVLVLGFMFLATPYIYYLRVETGQWTISGKLVVNIAGGELRVDTGDDYALRPTVLVEKVKVLLLAFFFNLIGIQVILAYLLPILIMITVSLGIFGEKWVEERIRREIYLIGFCMFTVMAYTATVQQTRYFYMLLPIFFGWIALGIVVVSKWFNATFGNWVPDRARWVFERKSFVVGALVFLFLYTMPINFFLREKEELWTNTAYEERDAGLWLRENAKGRPIVFSASRRPVFYALGEHVNPVSRDLEENYRDIIEKKVDYVILGDRALLRNEFLAGLEKRLVADGRFEQVYMREDVPGYGIAIYKRKE
ncbi:MAG: glycosyltransferase family 39 protein [Acidobacteriota bacterium]|nr:MAG: glycosyltransferase family 39 protein [Acidobacteriota bacterium]